MIIIDTYIVIINYYNNVNTHVHDLYVLNVICITSKFDKINSRGKNKYAKKLFNLKSSSL